MGGAVETMFKGTATFEYTLFQKNVGYQAFVRTYSPCPQGCNARNAPGIVLSAAREIKNPD